MNCDSFAPVLTEKQFARISRLAYEQFGLSLRAGKEALVRSRLTKRMQAHGLTSFDQYIDMVERKGQIDELRAMIDALTTNQTSFFREPQHFLFLRDEVMPELRTGGGPLRFWSAGCSTKEEPYTLSIVLHETVRDPESMDCRILATDISERVLASARQGVYSVERLRGVPGKYLERYFTKTGSGSESGYAVAGSLRSTVRFARLNLIHRWPMKGPFDVIFCRNVMIYFDLPTRNEMTHRFAEMLRPGGHLFVGHSESLAQTTSGLVYVQPAVYRKR